MDQETARDRSQVKVLGRGEMRTLAELAAMLRLWALGGGAPSGSPVSRAGAAIRCGATSRPTAGRDTTSRNAAGLVPGTRRGLPSVSIATGATKVWSNMIWRKNIDRPGTGRAILVPSGRCLRIPGHTVGYGYQVALSHFLRLSGTENIPKQSRHQRKKKIQQDELCCLNPKRSKCLLLISGLLCEFDYRSHTRSGAVLASRQRPDHI